MINEDVNISLWDQYFLGDTIIKYTQLAVANLKAGNQASLIKTSMKKKDFKSSTRGRPRPT